MTDLTIACCGQSTIDGCACPPEPVVIDLEKEFFASLADAAEKSKWMPPEYMVNDWVSDCRGFLINGPNAASYAAGARAMQAAVLARIDKLIADRQGANMARGTTEIIAAVKPILAEVLAPCPVAEIDNPTAWFFAYSEDAEWWQHGGKTREEAIAKAQGERGPEPFYLVEARRMVPSLKGVIDAEDVIERINDDEAWGEDGFEGAGDSVELQARLDATLKQWFVEECDLTGAQLDFVTGPERVG